MTRKTNLILVIKVVDLNTSHIYSCNYMVGMDKIFSSDLIELLMYTTRNKILLFFPSFLLIFTITILISGYNCDKPIHHWMDQLGFDPSPTSHSFNKFASPNFQTKKKNCNLNLQISKTIN
jgi:hypothetical protein